MALANALVGRPVGAPCYELFLRARLTVECLSEGAISVVGCACRVRLHGRELAGNHTYRVRAGDVAIIETLVRGCAYVAFGETKAEVALEGWKPLLDATLFVVPGPQRALFGSIEGEYAVSLAADRVGMRLDGPLLPHGLELPSEPSEVGALQVTPQGQFLLVGPEGPTLGGYPKPLVVSRFSRQNLGDLGLAPFAISEVSFEEAAQRESKRRAEAESLLQKIRWRIS